MIFTRNKILLLFNFIFIISIAGLLFASQDTARISPNWIRDAVIYEVFTRDFGPEGKFNEVEAKILELKQLGVTVIWLMPIHPIGKEKRKGTWGSPYSVQDYREITPDYGTKEDLKSLVQTAHRYKMKVIIDWVANHSAWDHSWITEQPEYYHKDSSGQIIPPNPYWEDVAWLDYSNSDLRQEMIDILKYWVEEYDIDGYRCDVAGMVPINFWESVRDELEKIKPEIFMLAEAYEPAHHLKAFDMSYSWPLYDVFEDTIKEETPAHFIVTAFQLEREKFPVNSLFMRFIDNHDKNRAPLVFGETGWKPAAAISFLLPGVPLLYNSQEIGDTTKSHDPYLFEKNAIQWPGSTTNRSREYYEYYKKLLQYRQNYPAIRSDNIEFLPNDKDTSVVTFLRWDSQHTLFAAINFTNQPKNVSVDLGNSMISEKKLFKNLRDPSQSTTITDSKLSFSLPAYDYHLWLVR